MSDISREELLRRAEYHAREIIRLLDEANERHEKAVREQPDLNKWVGKSGPKPMWHPRCLACGQHHPGTLPCPHMMTMS